MLCKFFVLTARPLVVRVDRRSANSGGCTTWVGLFVPINFAHLLAFAVYIAV